jgi:tRNA-specific 2-thiouridylase
MSGGVDSSVAAAILAEAGAEVVGLSLRVYDLPQESQPKARSCCAPEDLYDARAVAQALGIAHYVLDATHAFAEDVIGDFVGAYTSGFTPNPCVRCNERTKFRDLLHRARTLGCDALATGHYARIVEQGGALSLARGVDARRDQSYFLFTLGQGELAEACFPLGDMHKDDVRAFARARWLPVADKPDSQDICFVSGEKAADFVERHAASAGIATRGEGEIVDGEGRVLGTHRGVHRYTVGQRHGLGVVGTEPKYVVAIDAAQNRLVVGGADALLTAACRVTDVRFSREAPPSVRALVQVRSRTAPAKATIEASGDSAWVRFESPVRAVAPGQAAVFYDGDAVLGGGWIAETARA